MSSGSKDARRQTEAGRDQIEGTFADLQAQILPQIAQIEALLTPILQGQGIDPADTQQRVAAVREDAAGQERQARRDVQQNFAAQGQARSGLAQKAEASAAGDVQQAAGQQILELLLNQEALNQNLANQAGQLGLQATDLANQAPLALIRQYLALSEQFNQIGAQAPTAGSVIGGFVPLIGAGLGAALGGGGAQTTGNVGTSAGVQGLGTI